MKSPVKNVALPMETEEGDRGRSTRSISAGERERGSASERGEQRRRGGAHGETERNSPLREDRMKYEPDETSLVEAEEPD